MSLYDIAVQQNTAAYIRDSATPAPPGAMMISRSAAGRQTKPSAATRKVKEHNGL